MKTAGMQYLTHKLPSPRRQVSIMLSLHILSTTWYNKLTEKNIILWQKQGVTKKIANEITNKLCGITATLFGNA